MNSYRAPWWLAGNGALGGNAQTIWAALAAGRRDGPAPRFQRERWNAPDGDFIDVDKLEPEVSTGIATSSGTAAAVAVVEASIGASDARGTRAGPLLVLFHGLEGSSSSHYATAFADRARALGWHFAIPHFRGCSGEQNLMPRAYHSGDYEEVGWILERFRLEHAGPVIAAGVSLGGNALLRWAEEAGESAARLVHAVAAVSAPIDLAEGGRAIGSGFNKLVYTRMFLKSMRPKALAKLEQFPGLFDRERLMAAGSLYEFDDVFTAPLHGFTGTDDYWLRASAGPHLSDIRIPALIVNALNDPFVPARSLPTLNTDVGRHVTLWQPAEGGHVGFPHGGFPGKVLDMPDKVLQWLAARIA